MKAPITRRLVDTESYAGASFRPYMAICPVCGEEFEVLSSQWAYKIYTKSDYAPVCTWRCIRAHEAKKPKPALRGEYLAETMCKSRVKEI